MGVKCHARFVIIRFLLRAPMLKSLNDSIMLTSLTLFYHFQRRQDIASFELIALLR